MTRIIPLLVLLSALHFAPAFAGDALPDGVWNQTCWDQCLWASDSTPKHPKQSQRCKDETHYSTEDQHYFTLGESELGGGDVLAPEQSLNSQ